MLQLKTPVALARGLCFALTGALGWFAAGCGPDLGTCDMAALGGSVVPGMEAPHTGQQLVNISCAAGRCHSELAVGANRVGAPAGLNFDVVPADTSPAELAKIQRGATTVQDEAEEMWELIDSGEMPPEGQGATPSPADKESIRNWLACGAEVIAAPANTGPVTADLDSIFNALNGMTCKACHSAGPDTNFLASDACNMYNLLVGKPAGGSICKTTMPALVVAGSAEGSLLFQKLNPGTPPCGSTMPLGAAPLAQTDPALVENIRQWIAAGAPKPATCP